MVPTSLASLRILGLRAIALGTIAEVAIALPQIVTGLDLVPHIR